MIEQHYAILRLDTGSELFLYFPVKSTSVRVF